MKGIPDNMIRDIDCTIDTPVTLGVPDTPIYGKGIRRTPRVEGRTDSEHFKKIYLPELLPLEEYDLIVVLISGGKVAMFLKLQFLEGKERRKFFDENPPKNCLYKFFPAEMCNER